MWLAVSYSVHGDNVDKYVINNYFTHKFDDNNFLITSEHGSWVLLDKKEFELLHNDRVEEDLSLFSLLEQKGFIINLDNFDEVARMYKNRHWNIFSGIIKHSIHIDGKIEFVEKIVDFIFNSPSSIIEINFIGNTLKNFSVVQKFFNYIYSRNETKSDYDGWYYGKKKLRFVIKTDMNGMNEEIMNYIIDKKFILQSFLDGPKELHEKNRKYLGGNSYDDTVYWINCFKKDRNYKFFVSLVPRITRFSLGYHKEIIDEYANHLFNRIFSEPKIFDFNEINYDSKTFLDFWKKSFEYIIEKNKDGGFIDETVVQFLKHIITQIPPVLSCLNSPCPGCTAEAGYDENGNVYVCEQGIGKEIFSIGNINDGYKKVFSSNNSKAFIEFSSNLFSLCDSCVWHPFCSTCLVSSYKQQENMIIKNSKDFLCKIRQEQLEYIFKKFLFSDDKGIIFGWIKENT